MDEDKKKLEEQENSKEEHEEYSFLQETIKDESKKGKRIFGVYLRLAGKAVVFGLVASLIFSASKPWFDGKLHQEKEVIMIPEEEKAEDEIEDDAGVEETAQEQNEKQLKDGNRLLTARGIEVMRSVVSITASATENEWIEDSYDKDNMVAGLIMAENSNDILIFAKTSQLNDESQVKVTFTDGKKYDGTLYKQDRNLGYGVYRVAKNDLGPSTVSQIRIATLGSTSSIRQGDIIIVAGNPFGYPKTVAFGNISVTGNEVSKVDGTYGVVNTTVAAAEGGTGVVANLNGDIIGIVDQDMTDKGAKNIVRAYSVADLKKKAEKLLNNESISYTGLNGIVVPEKIREEGLPEGIYIRHVDNESPAMAAGIQRGDIINRVNEEQVSSVRALNNEIFKATPGTVVKLKGLRQGAGGEYVNIDFSLTVGTKE
ncbi:MAG TPA: S1C family serine protease [Candidatus Dorea intestinavium]|nr:S1C family serine protease [Candidatus Dorea intestinavium]